MPRWVVYIVAFFLVMVAVDVGFVLLSVEFSPELVPIADEWQGLKR